MNTTISERKVKRKVCITDINNDEPATKIIEETIYKIKCKCGIEFECAQKIDMCEDCMNANMVEY